MHEDEFQVQMTMSFAIPSRRPLVMGPMRPCMIP